MRLLALLLVLVPVLFSRVAPALADDPDGVVATRLVYAHPIEFPLDTAFIIETGCSHCDASNAGYYRVYRGSTGPVQVEPVVVPTVADAGLSGMVASTDGSYVVAITCVDCTYLSPGKRIHWSDDGGITWTVVGETASQLFPVAALPEGPVFVDFSDPNQVPRFFDGTPLNDDQRRRVPNRYLLPGQWNDATKTLSSLDGGVLASMPFADNAPSLLAWPGRPPIALWWRRNLRAGTSFYYYLTQPSPDGGQVGVRTMPFAVLHGWLDDFVLGSFDAANGNIALGMSVGLLDLKAGIVYPIGAPFGEAPLRGRNFVVQVQRGPFLRVVTPECLPLRAWAGAFASQTACAAPGVLLRPTGGVRYEHGVEWREATMPNGTTGWVPRPSVEG